jgi:glycosyltransferase involved in cell wall biosynthesis
LRKFAFFIKSAYQNDSVMLFSLLIANYNNSRFLTECLDSIYEQTYKNWEVIIVDDGSQDNFEEIISNYLHDARIKVYRNSKNEGCAFTKNRLASLITGEIAAFLDPDDTLRSDALEVMANLHQQHPGASIIHSTHYVCDAALNVQRISDKPKALPHGIPYLLLSDGTIHAFATFKKDSYNQTAGVVPERANDKAVDQDLYYILEEVGDVVFINEPLYYYRIHKGSISNEGQEAKAMISHNHIIMEACLRRIKKFKKAQSSENLKWIKVYKTRYWKIRILNSFRTKEYGTLLYSLLIYPFVGGMENIISYIKKIPSEGFAIFRRSFVETYKH